jgi:hypothetical protein
MTSPFRFVRRRAPRRHRIEYKANNPNCHETGGFSSPDKNRLQRILRVVAFGSREKPSYPLTRSDSNQRVGEQRSELSGCRH